MRAKLAAFACAGLAAALLSSCTKPTPQVTVLSGHTVSTLRPQTYCFSTDPRTCHIGGNVAVLTATAGQILLVDVPRAIADQGWSVTSAVLLSNGDFQTIAGATYASSVASSHSTRVQVPVGLAADSYYLIVRTNPGSNNGTWVAQVAFPG